ncbi:MAG: MerR family transcriptional regulator [Microlunatus sp.]
MNDDLVPVGSFAKLSGLSEHTLRHYDAIGLLAPAHVDPRTGYRRYSPDQLTGARLIADLRWLGVSLAAVRTIVLDPDSDQARALLADQTDRLVRQRDHLDRQIAKCSTYATEGIRMPTIATTITPVQIRLGVSDKARAELFYGEAFGLVPRVVRHTRDQDDRAYQFGDYGQPGFFLLFLVDESDFDRPGSSTIGFLVPDLDGAHRRAVQAGGAEAVAPVDQEDKPRSSAVTDPDGNWIWLHQG